jgi:hypothetical protein
VKIKKNTKELLLVLAVFIVAVAFRLWFISLAPQPFIYDQEEYETYASKMTYQNIFSSHTYRSYPYPLFLTIIYKFAGFGNHQAVFFVQAVLDSLIGVIIWALLRSAFRNRIAAWVGLVGYSFNPFTSGYVGVELSEILSAFFIISSIGAGFLFIRRPSLRSGLAVGFVTGMAAETRNAAFVWALIPLGLLLVFVSLRRYKAGYTGVIIGLVLTMLYPLYVNWRDFREISITTVDSFYAKEFYNGVVFRRLPPFTIDYPWEARVMFQEYYSEFYPGRTSEERRAMAKKYMDKTWAVIKSDPWEYLRVRMDKMWYVWQKENIFFYREPEYESHRMYTYALNLVILGLAAAGLVIQGISSLPKGLQRIRRLEKGVSTRVGNGATYIWWAVAVTVAYCTLVFSLTHAEYRITIPFYPLLFLVASLGLISLWHAISRDVSSFH